MLLHGNAVNNETSSYNCGALVIRTRDSIDGKFHANAKLVVNRLLKALYTDQTDGADDNTVFYRNLQVE